MHLKRLVEFMAKLAMAGMGQEAIAVRGYDFALTGLLAHAECDIVRGETILNTTKIKLMEQAAVLIVQATGLLEVDRNSLAEMSMEQG